MTERISFHFDPLCPWCYQTSRWVRQLAGLGVVEVEWKVFSLELANAGNERARVKNHARSARSLRTAMLVREKAGSDGVGAFYAALGKAIHEDGEAADDVEVISSALESVGLDASLQDVAMDDTATWAAVEDEHRQLVERTRSFGVPTIVLDGGNGPAIFGPVISEVPSDDDAIELFRHVAWLTRYENFSELKRQRVRQPDLASVRRR